MKKNIQMPVCNYDQDNKFNRNWQNECCSLTDAIGKLIIPYKYHEFRNFSEGMAAVSLNGKWGFIDKTGDEVVALIYDEVRDFRGERAIVFQNGMYGFVDRTGNEVIK